MLARIGPAFALPVPSRFAPKVVVLFVPQIMAEIAEKVGFGLASRITPRTVPGTVPRAIPEVPFSACLAA